MSETVSVITRTRDRPILLQRACQSVLSQSHTDWRHIIVNDGGNRDVVEQVVRSFSPEYGQRVMLIHRETSSGMEAASNHGLRHAEGAFIAIHDDDDSWHPDFLQKTVSFLRAKDPSHPIQGVITHSQRIVEEIVGDEVRLRGSNPFNNWINTISVWRMLEENCFPPISFLFSDLALKRVGFFNESLPVLGDWEFNLRFLRYFDIGVIPEQLANYHHRTNAGGANYANTVGNADPKHRETERALIARWEAAENSYENNLAAACETARGNLLLRRSAEAVAQKTIALRSEITQFESFAS